MGSVMRVTRPLSKSLLLVFLGTLFLPIYAAEPTIVSANEIQIQLMIPLLIAIIFGLTLWRWLLPLSLSNLQVAFEVDEGLYEVHRLTKNKRETMRLLSAPKVAMGSLAYLLAMTGILLIVAELLIQPSTFYEPVIYMMLILISFPIIISPFVTLYAQLSSHTSDSRKISVGNKIYGMFTTIILVLVGTIAVASYGYQKSNMGSDQQLFVRWIGFALLTFMAPTILAFGRIMGASWNTLIINKWRTMKGRSTAIDPDSPGYVKRFASLVIVIFLATMPLTAINGIVTLIYVEIENPPNANSLLDLGGIIGWEIFQFVENNPILQTVISLKALEFTLASYLMLNVAVVGLDIYRESKKQP